MRRWRAVFFADPDRETDRERLPDERLTDELRFELERLIVDLRTTLLELLVRSFLEVTRERLLILLLLERGKRLLR